MNSSGIGTASFGPFRLSPATRKLERDGVPLELGDRALDILIALTDHAGEIVSHRDLITRVWRDLVVSPGNLRVHITHLRKVLGDGESGARYIENVTGQGYCFVAQVKTETSADSAAPPVAFPDVAQSIDADLVAERIISVIGIEGRSEWLQEDRPSYISTDVEYALHSLLFLVAPSGGSVAMSACDLADLHGISAEKLEEIFRKLRQAEIVVDVETSGGGFALARSPDKIRFLDVIVAIDGRRPLFECKNVRLRCAIFGGKAPQWAAKGLCAIHAVMLEAEASMRAALAQRTLADLASRVAAKAPATFVDDMSSWLMHRTVTTRSN